MARKKQRTDDPYPSSPMRPPTHNIWLKYGSGFERMQIHCYCTDWAAWMSLAVAINERKFKLVDKTMGWYETEDENLRFRIIQPSNCNILKDQPTRDWKPGPVEMRQLRIAAGFVEELDTPHNAPETTREKNRRKTRARAPAASKDGLISIGEICESIGMNPRDARKILRGKVEKPDVGWAWPKGEVDAIKKVLKG